MEFTAPAFQTGGGMNVRSFTYEGFDTRGVHKLEAFDTAAAAHVPLAPPPPRPVFTTEEIELAKTLAREEGLREGQELAKKRYDEEKAAAAVQDAETGKKMLEEINAKLGVLVEEGRSCQTKFSDRLGQLALSIARKVCGDVSDAIIEQQIQAIINESVARLDAADKIKIHLNARNAAHLNDKFAQGAVSVDEKMELGDFRIEWQNGFAERDVKKLWKSIGEICARQSSLEENETEAEITETIKQGE